MSEKAREEEPAERKTKISSKGSALNRCLQDGAMC
jgi:hypothetical protein